MKKITWVKSLVWNGVLTVWSIEDNKSISIIRDRRDEENINYPYMLEINGEYRGHYRRLSVAKKDALILDSIS